MDIAQLAQLANLPLNPEQSAQLPSQMDRIIEYVSKLSIDPQPAVTTHASGLINVTRPDLVQPSHMPPETYVVPAVIDEL